jgi:hypothetical protein
VAFEHISNAFLSNFPNLRRVRVSGPMNYNQEQLTRMFESFEAVARYLPQGLKYTPVITSVVEVGSARTLCTDVRTKSTLF